MTTANLSEKELPAPPVEKELPAAQYHGDNPKVLIVILVVVLVASLVVSLIFFLIIKQNQPTTLPQLKPFTTVTPTTTPNIFNNTDATDSANWKIYTDNGYGFEIKYPEPGPEYLKKQIPTKQYLDNDLTVGYRLILSENILKRQDFLLVVQKVDPAVSVLEYWKNQQTKNGASSVNCTQYQCVISYDNSNTKHFYELSEGELENKKILIIDDPDSNYGKNSFPMYSKMIIFRINGQYIMQINKGLSSLTDQILSTFKFTNQ